MRVDVCQHAEDSSTKPTWFDRERGGCFTLIASGSTVRNRAPIVEERQGDDPSFVGKPGSGATAAQFEFDGRILHGAGDSWLSAGASLRRPQDQLAAYIEQLAT
jgi:hypothetical protein